MTARTAALSQDLDVEFRQEDMRHFHAHEEFYGGIFVDTTLGAFDNPDDDAVVLHNIWSALKPGAPFIVDCRHRDAIVRKCPPIDQFWNRDGIRGFCSNGTKMAIRENFFCI